MYMLYRLFKQIYPFHPYYLKTVSFIKTDSPTFGVHFVATFKRSDTERLLNLKVTRVITLET